MDRHSFERLVAQAMDALPTDLLALLDNVEIVVEQWPDAAALKQVGIRDPGGLLGLYHGVPKTQRTRSYTLVLPDKISIYQKPIQLQCRTSEEVQTLVEHVLRHEIAHHFGIDDERLKELGVY